MRVKTQATSLNTQLNSSNYYDHDTDFQYQSATMFKNYLDCEAKTQAMLLDQWKPPENKEPLLMGNYLHSYFESSQAHEEFIEANKKELLSSSGKSKGQLKSNYKKVNSMIDALAKDKRFCQLYQGEREAIVTGDILGVPWKGKIDCLNLNRGYFIDLKTTRDLHKRYWNNEDREWQSFAVAYNYPLQMWVYQQLIHQTFDVWCQPYIVAVDKAEVPDKAILSIPGYRLEQAGNQISEHQDRIESVRHGEAEPVRCEMCDYCKSTKQINEIISIDDLIE